MAFLQDLRCRQAGQIQQLRVEALKIARFPSGFSNSHLKNSFLSIMNRTRDFSLTKSSCNPKSGSPVAIRLLKWWTERASSLMVHRQQPFPWVIPGIETWRGF
jgi:hypothetical protein